MTVIYIKYYIITLHAWQVHQQITHTRCVCFTCVVKKQNTIQLSHQARLTRGNFRPCENISAPPLAIQAGLGTRLNTHKIWKLLAHALYHTTHFLSNFARLYKTTVTGRLTGADPEKWKERWLKWHAEGAAWNFRLIKHPLQSTLS